MCVLFILSIMVTSVVNSQFLKNNMNRDQGIPNRVKLKNEYDFIVIGAGSAGTVITNRLTENLNWDVLLIEAGQEESYITDIPLIQAGLGITNYNWGYTTEKISTACLGLKNGKCAWPAGKAVGGTSVINDLLYNKGTKYDYDRWESLGNRGWGYDDVLPLFKKSERAKLNNIDNNYHGYEGLLDVQNIPYTGKLLKTFLNAVQELNYTVGDVNGKNSLGFGPVQCTMLNGRKCSVSKAFIRPIRSRPNFYLSKQSFVTKLIIDPLTNICKGVQFRKDNKLYEIHIRKELILSAGTTNSAKILLLSGIGPKEHLQSLNISLIQDLPVGHNLQDHVSFPGLVFLVNESITLTGPKILSFSSIAEYVTQGRGPYTVPGGAEGYGFINTGTNGIKDPDYADLEIILAGAALHSDTLGIIRNLLRIPDNFYNNLYDGIKDKEGFALVPINMKPFSRGRIMLRSKNPDDNPVIYPNFLQDERDVNVILNGIEKILSIINTTAFASISARLNPRPYPGCSLPLSRTYWECALRRYTSSLFHYSGTCKMGPPDQDSVVDDRLRVYGVQQLRVADASIVPEIPAAHTNAVVIMIGEKASEMIKEDWKEEEKQK